MEETKKYHFYKESNIGAYYIEGDNPEGFIKKDDYYFTDYSEWFRRMPDNKNDREIKERNVYVYNKIRKLKKFYLEVDDDTESLLEFAIYFGDYGANNSANCSGCSDGYYMYMKDDRFDIPFQINKIFITYEDYHNPNELRIKVMFNKENVHYKIIIFDENYRTDILYEKEFISDLDLHEYVIGDFDPVFAYEDEMIKYEEDENMHLKESYKEYAYRDKYYLYEYKIKTYYPTYEISLDGYIKDESDFIIEKKYYYLESANIKDKIVITTDNYDLTDYVKTNIPFEVASNIDISKNGNYKIKYIFPAKTIETDVKVNANLEYIENLETTLKEKNSEIEDVIKTKNEMIDRLENNIKTKDEIISKKNVERIVTKSSPIPIILITMGVMLIIICIIKSFKKLSN